MPVELIPNQPIIFQDPIGQYPCLNNDPRQYAVLMQENDQLCMQWKLTECNLYSMCEPNMVMDPVGSNLLSTWSVTGDWDTTGSSNLSFGWGSGLGGLTYGANQNVTFIAGAVYKLTFDVTIYTGDKQYEVYLSPSAIPQYFNALGSYTLYFIGPPTGGSQSIYFRNLAGTYTFADSILIENIELIQVTDCWLDDFDTNVPSWTYSFDGNNGRFCSRIFTGGDLINTNAFVNTGNYHGVSLTIDDCSYGGLQVFLGGVLLGTTSGNGQFNFYGTPTSGTDLTLVKTGDFNGCVSLVSVKDYGDITGYYVQMFDNDSTNFVNITPVSFYDDRIVLCTTIEDLDWEFGVPSCTNITVELTEGCNGQKYTSVNTINWNQAGHECTKVVEAWNDGYAFGFYFGDVAAPDFKLIHRLRVLAFNPVYQNAAEEYLYSSGNRGRSFAQSQKARTAWFDYCDEYAHDVIRLQLLSQKLFIDSYAFFYPVADYEPEWNDRGKYNLAQSRVTVFHEETVFGSTCGTFANAICPPTQQAAIITQVTAKVTANYITLGLPDNDVCINYDEFDTNGNYISSNHGVSCYDLTAGTSTLYTALKNIIDAFYATSVSGSVNYNAGTFTLTIDLQGSINTVQPIKSLIIYLVPSTGTTLSGGVHIPIYFQ